MNHVLADLVSEAEERGRAAERERCANIVKAFTFSCPREFNLVVDLNSVIAKIISGE
jgi:hypothetical protein